MIAKESSNLSADALSQLPLFEGERPAALEWFAKKCHVAEFPADSILLSPEQPEDTAFLILEGQVQVRLSHHSDRIIATVGAGQMIGEMSVIEHAPPSAFVVAGTPCRVLAIEGTALREILEASNVVALNLLKLLARRLRNDNLIVRESMEQQAVSEHHARIDALTGLYNRRWLDETLASTIEQHRINGKPLTLLMLDLDRFKNFNDTHGHLAGDHALVEIARILKAHIRHGDHAARFGGEEFLVLLPETGVAEAMPIAERLHAAVRTATILDHRNRALPTMTVSVGLAEWCTGETASALVARADGALYRAKREGRDRIAVSSTSDENYHALAEPSFHPHSTN